MGETLRGGIVLLRMQRAKGWVATGFWLKRGDDYFTLGKRW